MFLRSETIRDDPRSSEGPHWTYEFLLLTLLLLVLAIQAIQLKHQDISRYIKQNQQEHKDGVRKMIFLIGNWIPWHCLPECQIFFVGPNPVPNTHKPVPNHEKSVRWKQVLGKHNTENLLQLSTEYKKWKDCPNSS